MDSIEAGMVYVAYQRRRAVIELGYDDRASYRMGGESPGPGSRSGIPAIPDASNFILESDLEDHAHHGQRPKRLPRASLYHHRDGNIGDGVFNVDRWKMNSLMQEGQSKLAVEAAEFSLRRG